MSGRYSQSASICVLTSESPSETEAPRLENDGTRSGVSRETPRASCESLETLPKVGFTVAISAGFAGAARRKRPQLATVCQSRWYGFATRELQDLLLRPPYE